MCDMLVCVISTSIVIQKIGSRNSFQLALHSDNIAPYCATANFDMWDIFTDVL